MRRPALPKLKLGKPRLKMPRPAGGPKSDLAEAGMTLASVILGTLVVFWPIAFITQAFTEEAFALASVLAPVASLATHWLLRTRLGYAARTARRALATPPWARLLILAGIALAVAALAQFVVGFLQLPLIPHVATTILVGVLVATALARSTGMHRGIRTWFRDRSARTIVLATAYAAMLLGLLAGVLLLLILPYYAVVLVAPALLLGAGYLTLVTLAWRQTFVETVLAWPIWAQIILALAVGALLGWWAMLVVGPLLQLDAVGFAAAAIVGTAVAWLTLVILGTRQRIVTAFLEAGSHHRALFLLPAFLASGLIVFLAVALSTGVMEAAALASLPGAIIGFLLLARTLGALEGVPELIRSGELWIRLLFFLLAWLGLSAYLVMALGLLIGSVQVSVLVGGVAAAAALVSLVKAYRLDAGMHEQFERLGGVAEAVTLVLLFLLVTGLVAMLLLSILPEAGPALLLSVLTGAAGSAIIANTLGLVERARRGVARTPWPLAWALILALAVLLWGYLSLGLGLALGTGELVYPVAAILAIPATIVIARWLGLWHRSAAAVRGSHGARVVLVGGLVLAGFLLSLFMTAGLVQTAQLDLLAVPYLVAFAITGVVAWMLAQRFGWIAPVAARLHRTSVAARLVLIVSFWLLVGILVGFLASAVIPLNLALLLLLGVLVAVPLLVLLAKAARVPTGLVRRMPERGRGLAAAGAGLAVFLVTLLVVLTVYPEPLGLLLPVLLGYLAALAVAARRSKGPVA